MSIRRPLYFGCWRGPGHFLFERGMQRSYDDGMYFLDGTLCPHGEQTEGVANLTHLSCNHEPVTVLSFWDRSVDKRGGCNSNFLLPGVFNFATALAESKRVFPEIFARFKFEVVEWKP